MKYTLLPRAPLGTTKQKSSKPAFSRYFMNLPYRNGAPPASRYRLCFLGLIQHSAILSSSRGVAACSTFIKAGKDEFIPWSLWPELAGAQPHWMRNRQGQQHSQCTHKRGFSSATAMCLCLMHGGWQEHRLLCFSLWRKPWEEGGWVAKPRLILLPFHL